MAAAIIRAWEWMRRHRVVTGVVGGAIWAAVMYPFVDALWIAVLCGVAFGGVVAAMLRRARRDEQP
jgi:hypothetical protein